MQRVIPNAAWRYPENYLKKRGRKAYLRVSGTSARLWEVIEFFGNGGVIYGAVETEENVLRKSFVMESATEPESMKLYDIIMG